MSQPVFISYARKTSRQFAEQLHQALGADTAFLDSSDIEVGERFPETIADALFASRVVVIFADETYFHRWYCLWELRTVLEPYRALPPQGSEAQKRNELKPLVVALAPDGVTPAEFKWLPPLLRVEHRASANDTLRLAEEVRSRLASVQRTLEERLKSVGLDPLSIRARLVEEAALPEPFNLAGFRPIYPIRRQPSLGHAFKGRVDDLWRIDFALSVRQVDGLAGAALTGALEGVGGAGKTRLALEYMHRLGRRHYPGGIFWSCGTSDTSSWSRASGTSPARRRSCASRSRR